jgi:hypothetical protein
MSNLTPGELQNALALSQAACYASMSAKEHRENSAQAAQMLRLTTRLVDLTLEALDGTVPEAQPVPDEPTLADIVEQTKAAAAAGQPAPQVVVDLVGQAPSPAPETPTIAPQEPEAAKPEAPLPDAGSVSPDVSSAPAAVDPAPAVDATPAGDIAVAIALGSLAQVPVDPAPPVPMATDLPLTPAAPATDYQPLLV